MEIDKYNQEYLAFISYQRRDEALAKRLQHALEYYKLPITVIEKEPSLEEGVRPIFVDMTELGDEPFLKPAIEQALKCSRFLIVICSPRSAKSKWVNKEVQYFVQLKRTKRIIPFIIEGSPNAIDKNDECCTPLLKKLLGERELLGISIKEMGFDAAVVKVVSRMFRIKFSALWNRYEKDKEEEQRKLKEQNDKLFISQSHFIAEKAHDLINKGDSVLAQRLLLEVLPQNPESDRPYVENVEVAFRKSLLNESAILRNHKAVVSFCVFSLDGSILATASYDNTICLWDTCSWKCKKVLCGHTGCVNSVSFNSNGSLLVSASDDGSIRIWEISSGRCLVIIKETEHIPISFYAAVFSPDNNTIIVTSNHEDIFISIWGINGKKKGVLRRHNKTVRSANFSNDGCWLATTSSDCTIIWDARTWKRCGELQGGCMSTFSNDGNYIAITGYDRTIRILETSNWSTITIIKSGKDSANSAIFSNNDSYLISSHSDGTVKIWNTQSGKCEDTIVGPLAKANFATFSPNNRLVAMAFDDGTIRIRGMHDNPLLREIQVHLTYVTCMAFNPEGKIMASGTDDGTIQIWDLSTCKCQTVLEKHQDAVFSISFSPSGSFFLSTSKDWTIRLWNSYTGGCIKIFRDDYWINKGIILPNEKQFISITYYTMKLWNIETGLCDRVFYKYGKYYCHRLSHDGNLIVAYNDENMICLWSVPKKKEVRIQLPQEIIISSISFTNDDNSIIVVTDDGKIISVGISKPKPYSIIKTLHRQSKDATLRLLNENSLLIIEDDDIGLFDLSNNHYDWIMELNQEDIVSYAIHPCKEYLAVGYSDGTIRIWDTPPLRILIDKSYKRLIDNLLTLEERRQYYLE